jgi:transcriptional regulator CtsR
MGISDLIAGFILNAMREADGVAELQRNELAQRFNCVPSQINYVVSTRFSPERGYIVESRRGGGGYIRISRVPYDSNTLGMHAVNSIGERVSASTARAILNNLLEAHILQSGTCGSSARPRGTGAAGRAGRAAGHAARSNFEAAPDPAAVTDGKCTL